MSKTVPEDPALSRVVVNGWGAEFWKKSLSNDVSYIQFLILRQYYLSEQQICDEMVL